MPTLTPLEFPRGRAHLKLSPSTSEKGSHCNRRVNKTCCLHYWGKDAQKLQKHHKCPQCGTPPSDALIADRHC